MENLIFPQFVGPEFENKWLDITSEEYHQRTDCVHYSSLKHILKSPHAYLFNLKNPKPTTQKMRIGSIAHQCILEGAHFLNKYVISPVFEAPTQKGEISTRSKAAKEKKEEWLKSLPEGTVIISQKESDDLRWMIDSILNHPVASQVLKDSIAEVKGIWRDEKTSFQSIMSVDFISLKNEIQGEFKTTSDCSWDNFKRQIEDPDMMYFLQKAIYNEGIKAISGNELKYKLWVVTENQRPFETRVFEVHPIYLEAGFIEYRKGLNMLHSCIKNNLWPQSQVIIEPTNPSQYFENKYVNQII